MSRNQLFYRAIVGLWVLLILLGAGMMFAVLTVSNESIVLRLVGAFTGALSGALGFVSGYLFGSRTDGAEKDQP